MTRLSIIIIFIFSPFWLLIQKGETVHYKKSKEISHNVSVHHPGKGKENIEEAILVEIQNKKGISVGYYMNVESVICIQKVCKIVPVRIYWNAIGEYQKYEMEDGVTLEKYEADVFASEDYIKLNTILANKNSPFKNVNVDEILTVPDETHNDIDAVSGATALELNEEDTVPGAALTCYTLWHWAYGDIQSIIRNITGLSCKSKDFESFLQNDNLKLKLFSIEQLTVTELYKKDLVEIATKQTTNNPKLLKATITYLEKAPDKTYFSGIFELIKKEVSQQSISGLNSLLNTKREIPKGYLDELSNLATSFSTFQQVSLFLRLMKAKNSNSNQVVKNVFPLLENDFIIGRSIYWFLKNQELNQNETEVLINFQKKHKDQL